jgi:hypothetical protein
MGAAREQRIGLDDGSELVTAMSKYTLEERERIRAEARTTLDRLADLKPPAKDVLERHARLRRQAQQSQEPPPRRRRSAPAPPAPTPTAQEAQMDGETQDRWNAWVDARINAAVTAAIAAERAVWEKQLHDTHVEIYETVRVAFETCTNTTVKFVDEAVNKGVSQSVATAERLLAEFHAKVKAALDGRVQVFDLPSLRDRTVN